MNAALLFCLARKTSLCEQQIRRFSGYFSLSVTETAICLQEAGLRPAMARLVRSHPVIFLTGSCTGVCPACARPLFDLLHIPLDSGGEPKGVLRLSGAEKHGYLIESLNQAIAVLPDEPEALAQMLPQALQRLKEKFSLEGQAPDPVLLNYESLIEDSMNRIARKE